MDSLDKLSLEYILFPVEFSYILKIHVAFDASYIKRPKMFGQEYINQHDYSNFVQEDLIPSSD